MTRNQLETLTVETPSAGVVVLRLDRPERLNAINEVMVSELARTCAELSADPSVHVVVLSGAGRGFCSGIDMRDFGPGMPDASAPAIDRLRFQETMAALPQAVRDMPQPVIAAVNGACVGAGLALCLAADIRICSTTATFGNAAILLGLSGAEMGMSYHLPRIVGTSVAADWMLTGRMVSAVEADRRGLVSEVMEANLLRRPGAGNGRPGRQPGAAGRAADQARVAGEHRRRRTRPGHRTGEPQPGTHPRDRRSGGPPTEVVDMSGPVRGVRIIVMGGLGPPGAHTASVLAEPGLDVQARQRPGT